MVNGLLYMNHSLFSELRPSRTTALVWGGYAALLLLAPFVFDSRQSLSILSLMGVAIIALLAFNILLGQGGMLSFGQAVYSGVGAFAAIHTVDLSSKDIWSVPITLVPLIGGIAGLATAAIFGYVITKRSGIVLAMITLGIGELVAAMAMMFPEFFGGENGVTGNRVYGKPFLGITFGPQIEVYYLIASYTLACTGLMYAFTRTPLGRMLNAVRDNEERVEFVGLSSHRIRYFAFMISGFFMGIAGGLTAINFELVTAEAVGTLQSGIYVLFAFLGGVTYFYGPIIGAILMVVAFALLSEFTAAWLLYLGGVFMLMVMFAPGGVASLMAAASRIAKHRHFAYMIGPVVRLVAAAVLPAVTAALLVEMIYRVQLNFDASESITIFGLEISLQSTAAWLCVASVLVVSAALFEFYRRRFIERLDSLERDDNHEGHRVGGRR